MTEKIITTFKFKGHQCIICKVKDEFTSYSPDEKPYGKSSCQKKHNIYARGYIEMDAKFFIINALTENSLSKVLYRYYRVSFIGNPIHLGIKISDKKIYVGFDSLTSGDYKSEKSIGTHFMKIDCQRLINEFNKFQNDK